MRVICAWCNKPMGEKAPLDDDSITHGMCQECHDKEMATLGELRLIMRDRPLMTKADMERIMTEIPKLPARKEKGHPDNELRAIAGGFIFIGNNAKTAIEKARAMIAYYNNLAAKKRQRGGKA